LFISLFFIIYFFITILYILTPMLIKINAFIVTIPIH
jgi:hypothetical protein